MPRAYAQTTLPFDRWLDSRGLLRVAATLGVSRHAVASWRRYSRGEPRSSNACPPTLEMCARIVAESEGAVTYADLLPSAVACIGA